MTKITIEDQYGRYLVELNKDDLNIQEVFEELIVPALLACGFSSETINKYLG